jgi:hypothetical protein
MLLCQPTLCVEQFAQALRKGFWLTGITILAAKKSAMMAWEYRRDLSKQSGRCAGRSGGKCVASLDADREHDAGRRGFQRSDVGPVVRDRA